MSEKNDILVDVETTKGAFTLQLEKNYAPQTVENFLDYAKEGFYQDTVFHRVLRGQMGIIQGGGLTENLRPKGASHPPIQNEANNQLSNVRGSIAMARTSDPHSASSQFFINTTDNTFLDHTSETAQGWGYCVFGRVVEGMDVVDEINSVETHTVGNYADVPVEPVKITTVTVR